MQRHFFLALVGTLVTLILALPPALRALLTDAASRAPESLAEAVEIAGALRLFHRYDGNSGSSCLLISEHELPEAPFCAPRMNNPGHPFWHGTAAIYADGRGMSANYDPACSVFWGTLFVYGDPDVIEQLTGRRP